MGEQFADAGIVVFAVNLCAEADAALFGALADDFVQTCERAAADKEDIGGVHIDELLVGIAPAALGRNAGHRAFHQFQQCLLYAFAGHVAGDGGAVGFAGNFVDFVYIDNTALGFFHVKVAVV